ncbi:complex I intermediate-associated protein 30-domain-containing protein [Pseudoneurospora amorphoporcata]|uniref:Complex I intermediate-associated protein 30-domain-containing protein n=1 Tax=Pseudoneurospora amorphoporcata TaxID=241081 RepID=A0AAN6SIW7_9PEZI|nr:complex I intermediate-associated protein 30-domain-containing protein [Pseudoneurospora amorphoporcata]
MRATQSLPFKGFWGRSLDELSRLTNIVAKSENIKGATGPREIHNFQTPESVADCKLLSDADVGGSSTAHLDWVPPANHIPTPDGDRKPYTPIPGSYARFHGTISLELPTDRREISRTGYAGFRTLDRPPTIFGRGVWDIDPYAYLAMRVKTDARSYFVNVRTESVVPLDLHQHRLFVKKPGQWETVLIKWNDFVRTNHGKVIEPQTGMLRQKVLSIGFSTTDRKPGPYELCVERLWATNDFDEAGVVETDVAETQLKNKQGEKVKVTWGPL